MRAPELVGYLDDYLRIREIPDYRDAYNGLEVEGGPEVKRIAVAVDACLRTIEMALEAQADLLITHHGLFWGQKAPVTGTYYQRLSRLIKNDLALYSCHLPLDCHPEVGNNAVLARLLGLTPCGEFAEYEGTPLGIIAAGEITRSELTSRLEEALDVQPFLIGAGPENLRKIGILTGGGGSYIAKAAAEGLDTLVTGEGAHHTYFDAEELGVNVYYAGHYATETVGVRALADHLAQRFGLETIFLDHPTGL